MKFLGVLTLVFVVLKLTGVITWSWLVVVSPLLSGLLLYLVMFVVGLLLAKLKSNKRKYF